MTSGLDAAGPGTAVDWALVADVLGMWASDREGESESAKVA
jgi:hypothetical protein